MTTQNRIQAAIEDYEKELEERKREYRKLTEDSRPEESEYLVCAMIHIREFVDVLRGLL